MKFIYKRKSGYTMIEIIFYVSIFAVLSLIVIKSIVVLFDSFKDATQSADFVQSANVVERISRELRQAESIANLTSDSVTLNTYDEIGNPTLVTFSISGYNIYIVANGATEKLNASTMSVSSGGFERVLTSGGDAVKFSLSFQPIKYRRLEGDPAPDTLVKTFYNTVVLRKNY